MEKKLGIKHRMSKLALFAGLTHDLPPWFWSLPKWQQIIYHVVFGYLKFSLLILIASTSKLLADIGTSDTGVFTETIGSMIFLVFGVGKAHLLYRKRHLLEEMLKKIHVVAEKFDYNPVGNKQYLKVHNKRCKWLQFYCDSKLYAYMALFMLVVLNQYIPGMIHPKSDSRTPMYGWFPLDYSNRLSFTYVCFQQYFTYILIGVRDLYADMTLLLIMSAVHAQLIFLRELLDDIINQNKMSSLGYWIKQHQDILQILNQFENVGGMVLFATYSYVALFFFFLLVRLTGDGEFEIVQQAAILAMTCSNMVHMYIISSIGDNVAESSVAAADAIENESLWDRKNRDQLDILQVAVRCTQPHYIVFGDNRKLCASSFGDIATAMFSYFNTVYQLRN